MINAFLRVEAIFVTHLHCRLLSTLCLVYMPLGNLKTAVPSDGLAYILVLKEFKYNSVFTSKIFLGIMSNALKPMKPRHRTSILTPFRLHI